MYRSDLPLLVATGNAHKLAEISELLNQPVISLKELPDAPEVVEDGDSFEANAVKKAAAVKRAGKAFRRAGKRAVKRRAQQTTGAVTKKTYV